MKILYIAYAFPPVNIVSAQRAMFQARYLAEAGAEVTVICAEQTRNRDDDSLLKYMKNTPHLTIHRITPWGRKDEFGDGGFKPSAKGFLWVFRVLLLVRKLLRTKSFDLVYTTFGPKYPHMTGRIIHSAYKLQWVAEYRDPWNGSEHNASKYSSLSFEFERWLMKPALLIVAVSLGLKQLLQKIHGNRRQYAVVYNGFEPGAYGRSVPVPSSQPSQHASVIHLILAGTVYPFQREALQLLLRGLQGRDDVTFSYYGASAPLVQSLVNAETLQSICRINDQVSHEHIVEALLQADVAVLPISRTFVGQLPVKFYDYLAARKPVLMLKGAGTEIEELMNKTHSGFNAETVADISTWLDEVQVGKLSYSFSGADFFTRENQAKCLLRIMNESIK
ncbi:MAG: glycosyltransferase [Methyloprofundus sp.]|nr:glycosyltransferase [Methyloprofundus sp.]